MSHARLRPAKGLFALVGLMASFAMVPAPARADLVIPTETLIEDQTANIAFLINFQGLDPHACVEFTSTNSANGDFTNATNLGETYLGQPLSITTTGTYDAGTDSYVFSAIGSLGADNWTVEGTATILRPPGDDITTFYNYTYFDSSNTARAGIQLTATVTLGGPIFRPTTSIDTGILTDTARGDSEIKSTDTLKSTGNFANQFTLKRVGDPYQSGFVDPNSGDGYSMVSFSATPCPEPSSMVLLAAGSCGLLIAHLRRRLRSESTSEC